MSAFRQYLEALEKAGQLVHVTKEVSTEFEVAAYVRKSSDTEGPAFVFEHVKGHPGWRPGCPARWPACRSPSGARWIRSSTGTAPPCACRSHHGWRFTARPHRFVDS